jgi:hypothetical protein
MHRRIARALASAAVTGELVLDDLAYHSWATADPQRPLYYNELAGDRAAAVHAKDAATTTTRGRAGHCARICQLRPFDEKVGGDRKGLEAILLNDPLHCFSFTR